MPWSTPYSVRDRWVRVVHFARPRVTTMVQSELRLTNRLLCVQHTIATASRKSKINQIADNIAVKSCSGAGWDCWMWLKWRVDIIMTRPNNGSTCFARDHVVVTIRHIVLTRAYTFLLAQTVQILWFYLALSVNDVSVGHHSAYIYTNVKSTR